VDNSALIKIIFGRLKKYRTIVLAAGVLMAVLAFFYARSKRTTYTSKATVFPLISPNDNNISNSMLGGILGISDIPKSFSAEATINIMELAQSKSLRQSIALARLPKFQNKTMAELLIEDINEHQSFFSTKVKVPEDSVELAIKGAEILKPNIVPKMSKNGVLEIYFTGTKEEYITPFSNVVIEKVSKFYVDLKKRKALDDYNFTLDKIDSLQKMIKDIDRQAVTLQNQSMFTPSDLLEYAIPKENVNSEKARILRQHNMYINNRDEAVWRLQKVTPIIEVLDKPTAPFDVTSQPKLLMMAIGFIAGCFLGALALISGILYSFAKNEISRNIFGETK
jgi:hypothetical protein